MISTLRLIQRGKTHKVLVLGTEFTHCLDCGYTWRWLSEKRQNTDCDSLEGLFKLTEGLFTDLLKTK